MTLSRFTSPAQENPDLCTWILPHSKSDLWTRKPLSAICCLEEQLLLWSLSGHEFVRVFQSADIAIVTTSWYWLQYTKCWRFCVHWWKLPSAPIKLTTLYKIAHGRKLSEVNPEHLSNPCSTVGLAANVNWHCILAIQTWSQMPCMQYCASSYLWGFRENSTLQFEGNLCVSSSNSTIAQQTQQELVQS
jgi:hypothetical protein